MVSWAARHCEQREAIRPLFSRFFSSRRKPLRLLGVEAFCFKEAYLVDKDGLLRAARNDALPNSSFYHLTACASSGGATINTA